MSDIIYFPGSDLGQDDDVATFTPLRSIGGIEANITSEEEHADDLVITEHPVETGAAVTDHAYKAPAILTLRVGWSNSSDDADGASEYVRNKYAELLALQATRQPFAVSTTKRSYSAMLMRSLAVTTDQATDNALFATVVCREIITVSTLSTPVPPQSQQAQPTATAATQNLGTQQVKPARVANESALSQVLGR